MRSVGICFESLADYMQSGDFVLYKLREIEFIYVCVYTHTHMIRCHILVLGQAFPEYLYI
jgi:hypothetical protein